MDFLEQHNLLGIVIGLATFLIIGVFHPLVIKGEYYIGQRCRWIFLVLGFAFIVLSIAVSNVIWQTLSGVTAFSCFWSIKEIADQRKRVERGWFPRNPRRKSR